MSTDFNYSGAIEAVPELEHRELDRRLRELSWPAAPADVKQRCLHAVLDAAASGPEASASGPEADPAPSGSVPSVNGHARRRVVRPERAHRYELTRWEPRSRVVGWSAPRRQPRFAAVL